MLLPEGSSAICVQRFDGSRNSAIHTTYRISLRSSSLREPRYPLLRVVFVYDRQCMTIVLQSLVWLRPWKKAQLSENTGCEKKHAIVQITPRKHPCECNPEARQRRAPRYTKAWDRQVRIVVLIIQ